MLLTLLMNLNMYGGPVPPPTPVVRDVDAPPPQLIRQFKSLNRKPEHVEIREKLDQIYDDLSGISDARAKKIKKLIKPFTKRQSSASKAVVIDYEALIEQTKLLERIFELYAAIKLDQQMRIEDEQAIAVILQEGDF